MPTSPLFTKPYLSPEEQVELRREWNHGGFTDEAILAMRDTVPADFDQDQPDMVLALCRTLTSVRQTVIADIEIMRHVFGGSQLFVSPRMNDLAEARLWRPDGAPQFRPYDLRWYILRIGNRDKAPSEIDPAIAGGAQVLSAAYNNPGRVLSQNGRDTPFWDVPGLRLDVGVEHTPFTPYLFGNDAEDTAASDAASHARVHLDTSSAEFRRLQYAEPTIVSC